MSKGKAFRACEIIESHGGECEEWEVMQYYLEVTRV
jgi:hypothetical protein